MFAYIFISSRHVPKCFKHYVFEIVFDVGFYSTGNKIKVSCSIQTKEKIVSAYDSCGEEQICVEAFDREM
jgi:hypothetical protein